jgi:hypothetical protein
MITAPSADQPLIKVSAASIGCNGDGEHFNRYKTALTRTWEISA